MQYHVILDSVITARGCICSVILCNTFYLLMNFLNMCVLSIFGRKLQIHASGINGFGYAYQSNVFHLFALVFIWSSGLFLQSCCNDSSERQGATCAWLYRSKLAIFQSSLYVSLSVVLYIYESLIIWLVKSVLVNDFCKWITVSRFWEIFTGPTSYFWALRSFHMFTDPFFLRKIHLLSTVLLSGFESSLGALKSTE